MTDTPTPAPRAPLIPTMVGVFGAVIAAGGLLITIGGWRSQVDTHLATLDKRMDQAEANQKTYIPVLIGLSKDVSFLADRARREDDRSSRRR
jgi:hypothetical protein